VQSLNSLTGSDAACGCAACAGQTPGLSRRGFLTGAVTVAAGAAIGVAAPGAAYAQTTMTPDAALQALMDGNRRFTERRMTAFDEDLSILKQNTVAKQEPFAAVLSCADSRVPVEIAFDQSIGHLFVARVAGNVTTPEITASLEYGALVLGTKVIMVLGHANCGAVKATMEGKPVPGQISALYAPIRPAVDAAKGDVEAAIRLNAQNQAHILAQASPVLAGLIKDNRLKVVAAYYDLASGRVSLLG
jgi:carbonic anhydrase